MQEYYTEVAVFFNRVGYNGSIHIGVSPGLPDQLFSNIIVVGSEVFDLIKDAIPDNFRKSTNYHTERFTSWSGTGR